jgi:serine/threonine-protein kinase RsbW
MIRTDEPPRYACRVARSMAGLACLGRWVDHLAAVLALPPATEYALRLCLEEAVANVVMHGGPNEAGASVAVAAEATAEALTVTIEDRGLAFDPVAAAPQSATPDRPGGHGLRLMRRYARAIGYARVNDTNRLTLTIARG